MKGSCFNASVDYFNSGVVNQDGDVVFSDGFCVKMSSLSNKEALSKLRDHLRENCMNNVFSNNESNTNVRMILSDSISQTHTAIYFSYVIEKLLEFLE